MLGFGTEVELPEEACRSKMATSRESALCEQENKKIESTGRDPADFAAEALSRQRTFERSFFWKAREACELRQRMPTCFSMCVKERHSIDLMM